MGLVRKVGVTDDGESLYELTEHVHAEDQSDVDLR